MSWIAELPRLVVVVGSGGVGKTTLAAALGVASASGGRDTLVMTFDPSLRLKDALGVGDEALTSEVTVDAGTPGRLAATLLDARHTFDRLVARYAPDQKTRETIFANRYYRHLAGHLAGILEYMAVERLFEVATEGGAERRIILDTPPTRQALDFLEAPRRIVDFLDSGALKLGLRRWFDSAGEFRPTARLGGLGRRFEEFLDEVVGLDLLREMTEFFQAFGPLYKGFRQRASEVEGLLQSGDTRFVLVGGPGEERIADVMFFARRLEEAGHSLGPIVINRVHPAPGAATDPAGSDGRDLIAALGRRDHRGLADLEARLGVDRPLLAVPLLEGAPTTLPGLAELAKRLEKTFPS